MNRAYHKTEDEVRLEAQLEEARDAARIFFHWLEVEALEGSYRTAPYLARFPWLKEKEDLIREHTSLLIAERGEAREQARRWWRQFEAQREEEWEEEASYLARFPWLNEEDKGITEVEGPDNVVGSATPRGEPVRS